MSFSHFFKSNSRKSLGSATMQLLSPVTLNISAGPICKTYRNAIFGMLGSRGLHTDSFELEKPVKRQFVAIGGGVGLMSHIEQFCLDYYAKNKAYPDICVITNEKNHWINNVNADFYERPWGQPKKALIKPYQNLLTKMFPELSGDQYPNLFQIQAVRAAFIDQVVKKYGITLIDKQVDEITQTKSGNRVMLKDSAGGMIEDFESGTLQLFNCSTQARKSLNPDLDQVGREGGLLYSEKKSDEPICMIGGGLSAQWATVDCPGPVVVVRKEKYPSKLKVSPERKHVSELIEEQSDIRVLKNGTLLVEGVDVKTGEEVRMRFNPKKCFLSSGTDFNGDLTKKISPDLVVDVNPFMQSGAVTGHTALNPEGGLTHRVAAISHFLGRYPKEEFINIAQYTRLWSSYVEVELSKKGLMLDQDYYDRVQPAVSKLFGETQIPSEKELEVLLRSIYESLPAKNGRPEWQKIKDIVVPITDGFEHYLHPDSVTPSSSIKPR